MEYTTDKEVWFVTGADSIGTFRGPSSSLAPDDPQPRALQGHGGGLKVSEWTSDELEKIGEAEELRIAPRRRDGSLRTPPTVRSTLGTRATSSR